MIIYTKRENYSRNNLTHEQHREFESWLRTQKKFGRRIERRAYEAVISDGTEVVMPDVNDVPEKYVGKRIEDVPTDILLDFMNSPAIFGITAASKSGKAAHGRDNIEVKYHWVPKADWKAKNIGQMDASDERTNWLYNPDMHDTGITEEEAAMAKELVKRGYIYRLVGMDPMQMRGSWMTRAEYERREKQARRGSLTDYNPTERAINKGEGFIIYDIINNIKANGAITSGDDFLVHFGIETFQLSEDCIAGEGGGGNYVFVRNKYSTETANKYRNNKDIQNQKFNNVPLNGFSLYGCSIYVPKGAYEAELINNGTPSKPQDIFIKKVIIKDFKVIEAPKLNSQDVNKIPIIEALGEGYELRKVGRSVHAFDGDEDLGAVRANKPNDFVQKITQAQRNAARGKGSVSAKDED